MDFRFLYKLKFTEYLVQLEFKRPHKFDYYHGKRINEWLCRALNPDAPKYLKLKLDERIGFYPVESGRFTYDKGDLYRFGLTVIGDDLDLVKKARHGLKQLGKSTRVGLDFGEFAVKHFKKISPTKRNRKLSDNFTLQFVTPLRLERWIGDQIKGHTYLDQQFFDFNHFLKLLHLRAHILATGKRTHSHKTLNISEVTDKSLTWFDVRYDNTLGGVVGFVDINMPMTEEWNRLLEIGQHIGAGHNTAKGYGRYLLNPCPESVFPKPAQTFLDLAIKSPNLVEAYQRVKQYNTQAGSDGETIKEFEKDLLDNLKDMVDSIRAGRYRSTTLKEASQTMSSGRTAKTFITTVRDSILQQAVLQILETPFERFLREHSLAYLQRRRRTLTAFGDVEWEIMERKLRTLFIFDPVVDLVMDWITQDVVINGKKVRRTRGLPNGLPISTLLAKIYTWIN